VSARFVLDREPSLSRSTVVRDELLRVDPERLTAGWAHAQVLRVDPAGRVAAKDGRLVLEPASTTGAAPAKDAVLLGEDGDTPVWAVPTPELEVLEGEQAVDLRSGGALLDDTGAGLLTTAAALLAWHAMARFCAVCGGRTKPVSSGWARRCTQCGREEYPRTDPAVICLVHDGADQVLLGRQPTWPVGRFSVLAGFVEAGESLEDCVEREVGEEVGAAVTDIHYLGSQPWPFPRSIMLGFEATADAAAPVVPRDGEIAEARWFTKDDVREALARGEWTGNPDDPGEEVPLLLPGSISIARVMLESWVG
jgi:NAD+ diphosphatase